MKLGKYILSIDQGTTSSRAIVFDAFGSSVGMGQKEFAQYYPQPGYVEHDATEILETVLYAVRQAVAEAAITAEEIEAIGITNQRETVVAWDRQTGIPICNAIVWQCRRTADICEDLKRQGLEAYIHETTGLVIDPYFSGTKMKWILEHVPKARALEAEGRLCFGTIDSWLVFSLTEGEAFVMDATNASRTMLFNLRTQEWDDKLLAILGIPKTALPQIVDSSGVAGMCKEALLGKEIPIAGLAGDQHAALFGQCCFDAGMIKNTYGTGCFVLMNTGDTPVCAQKGLITTIAWRISGKACYAVEGSAFIAGAAIQWLRDSLGIISTAHECDVLAESVEDNGGVSFVPGFTGLGAPYWDMYARGALLGLTRGTTKAHICRAVLESIALESYDLFRLIEEESGMQIRALRVDGGASKSDFLMQYQAGLIEANVQRPVCMETTALGSAMLAGLAVGVWDSMEELRQLWKVNRTYSPQMDGESRDADIKRWHEAVKRSGGWANLV